MSVHQVVKPLDAIELINPGLVASAIDLFSGFLCFQRTKEAFHRRVVPDLTGPAQRRRG